jgi:hypothetical protein
MQPTTGSVPRLRKRDLFASLGYEPHEGQILVHRSNAPRRVLACGVRWGKSTCGAMEAIAGLFELRERTLGWIVVPNYELGRRIFDQAAQTIEEHLRHRIIELAAREQRIVVRNFGGGTSELRVKSADNPVSLLGQALDFAILDEASRLRREVWQQHISQRLIDRKGWALLLSTPRGPGWFYSMFKRGQKGRDAQFESWSSPSWANPFLDRAAIEEERSRLPENTFLQEYEAKFTGTDNEACEKCGWPDVMAKCVRILKTEDEELPKCPECERYVDEEGHTIMGQLMDGSPYIKTIFLVPDPEGYERPPLPIEEP